MLLPGTRPTGAFIPMVIVSVCPTPSGERCSFSKVIPADTSALYWSSDISLPLTFILSAETSGAENSPGISSVTRSKLISAEPVLVNFKHEFRFWLLYERSPDVEYVFSTFASNTSNFSSSNLIEPSVELVARGRIVYDRS